MKRLALVIVLALFLTSCRTGDLMTVYSEGETVPPQSTEAVTEPPKLPVGSLKLIELTESVSAGKTASVTVRGQKNTEYMITVTYTSVSQAKGLEEKYTDENGIVSWSWRVGNNTKPGKYTIEIKSMTERIILYFNVTAPKTDK